MGQEEQHTVEAGLLRRVARRDTRAFEGIYDRYGRSVYSLALAMLRDAQVAQEVTQEVFLDLWRTAEAFDPGRGSARTWILALAHHKSVDVVRRRRARPSEPLSESTPNHRDFAEIAEAGVVRGRVRTALEALSPEQRAAITLAYYGGYTQQEIAERLRVPLGTVKTRMRDGMLRLREMLHAHVEETSR